MSSQRNKQKGVGLIEMLLVLAITVALTAALGQSMLSVIQSTNEKNVSAGLLALQKAEATYVGLYPSSGYTVTSSLSACPAAGGNPTANAACLLPASYTNGGGVFNYEIALSIPADAPGCSTAPCDFLAVATPKNHQAGRFTYCVNNDGVLHGAVELASAVTTDAQCRALEVITAGTASSAAASLVTYEVNAKTNNVGAGFSAQIQKVIPAGSYSVAASVITYATQLDGQSNPDLADCTVTGPPGAPVWSWTSGGGKAYTNGASSGWSTAASLPAGTYSLTCTARNTTIQTFAQSLSFTQVPSLQ